MRDAILASATLPLIRRLLEFDVLRQKFFYDDLQIMAKRYPSMDSYTRRQLH